jgi:hypothetical protein
VFLVPLSKGGHSCVDSYLGPLFCSTGLHICFCASTMLFLLLWLCWVLWLEVRYCDTSSVNLFAEYCLGYLQSLCFQMKFRVDFSISDECHWDSNGNCVEHVDCFW